MPFSHAGARALLSPPSCVPAQNHAVKRTGLICAWNRALPSWQGGPKTARLAPVHVVGWCRRGKRGEIAGCVASSSVSPRQGPERPGRAAPCQHARRWRAPGEAGRCRGPATLLPRAAAQHHDGHAAKCSQRDHKAPAPQVAPPALAAAQAGTRAWGPNGAGATQTPHFAGLHRTS
jgi:hypothetical protein